MNRLSLADLRLGLKELLENRHDRVFSCLSGRLYGPLLNNQLLAIDSLPPKLAAERKTGTNLGIGIDETVAAFFLHYEWYDTQSGIDPMILSAVRRMRDSLAPDLSAIQAQCASRVCSVGEWQNTEEWAACWKSPSSQGGGSMPMPTAEAPGGGFWIQGFIPPDMISENNDYSLSEDKRALATNIRNATIGLLQKFRQSLAKEIDANFSLPRGLDFMIFGYFDELVRHREISV